MKPIRLTILSKWLSLKTIEKVINKRYEYNIDLNNYYAAFDMFEDCKNIIRNKYEKFMPVEI